MTITPDLTEVLDNADEPWKDCAWRAMETLADSGRMFDANDITDLGVPPPDHPARWGALFQGAHKIGLIRPVGFTQSRRQTRHGGVIRLWIGSWTMEDRAA